MRKWLWAALFIVALANIGWRIWVLHSDRRTLQALAEPSEVHGFGTPPNWFCIHVDGDVAADSMVVLNGLPRNKALDAFCRRYLSGQQSQPEGER